MIFSSQNWISTRNQMSPN